MRLRLRSQSLLSTNGTCQHLLFVHPLLVNSQQEYTSCDTQAVGRVRRYGQGRVVQLYRFLVQHSIDEEIFKARREADGEDLLANCTPADTVRPVE